MPRIHYRVNMLQVLVSQTAIRIRLSGFKVWLVHLVAGLVQKETIVVGYRKLDVSGSLLRKPGGEAVPGQRDRARPHGEDLTQSRRVIGLIESDSRGCLEQFSAAVRQRTRNSMRIETGLIDVGMIAAQASLQRASIQDGNVYPG